MHDCFPASPGSNIGSLIDSTRSTPLFKTTSPKSCFSSQHFILRYGNKTMPVTVHPANHPARKWITRPATSDHDLLQSACRDEAKKCKRIIRSSFVTQGDDHIFPSPNGLVWAAYYAYSRHHHLTLRPEDVWFAILSQLSFYINAHAEELRSLFVAHKGKRGSVSKQAALSRPSTLARWRWP